MHIFFILLTCAVAGCTSDVIRTVFCKNRCADYLEIPESSMPLCAPRHLKMLECGTIITCDWAEAEHDKVRPVANSSDILCCYRTTIKEKGDCAEPTSSPSEHVQQQTSGYYHCPFHFLPWLCSFVLLIFVVLQAGFIVRLKMSGPAHQKVTQSDDVIYPRAVITHPLVNTSLLGTTSTSA